MRGLLKRDARSLDAKPLTLGLLHEIVGVYSPP